MSFEQKNVHSNVISFDFQACEPAARLALKDVNDKEDLLPGYHLNMHWNDSGVRRKSKMLFHLQSDKVGKKSILTASPIKKFSFIPEESIYFSLRRQRKKKNILNDL